MNDLPLAAPGSAKLSSLAEEAEKLGVRDDRLLEAMRRIRRVEFVPVEYTELAEHDVPIPIGHHQVTTQPSLVAAMIEAAAPGPHETVLEVGAGYGYQTALLARMSRFVWAVERWPDLAEAARTNLSRAGIHNALVITGDGSLGLSDHAPFDSIVVCAAFPRVPAPLIDQLAQHGRLVQPVGPSGGEEVNLYRKECQQLRLIRRVAYANFVPLVGTHGYSDDP